MENLTINHNNVRIDGKTIFVPSVVWAHTRMRIENAVDKAKEKEKKGKNFKEEFNKLMETRLYKMEKIEKLFCAIAVLHSNGYEDLAETYYSKIVLKRLAGEI